MALMSPELFVAKRDFNWRAAQQPCPWEGNNWWEKLLGNFYGGVLGHPVAALK
jgi:hypothetical protein